MALGRRSRRARRRHGGRSLSRAHLSAAVVHRGHRDILEALAKGADTNVATHLGRNPSLPRPRLVELSRHADTWVRQAVAANPSIDAEMAARLATEGDEQVRFFLAANHATPREVLEKLAADPASRVASRARYELERRR